MKKKQEIIFNKKNNKNLSSLIGEIRELYLPLKFENN